MWKHGIVAVTVLLWSLPNATAQTAVGLGGSLFFEDTDLNGVQEVSVQETDETENYESKGFLSANIWFLLKISEKFRAGSGLTYYGNYSGQTKPEEGQDEDNFEPEFFKFGKLVEFYGRFDYQVPVHAKGTLLFGAVFGVPILFPGGEFKEEIERLQDQGANVLSLPRIGYMVGPDIGGRYELTDLVNIRADFTATFSQLFLFATTQDVDNTAFRKRWTTRTLRYQFTLGVEIDL